MGYSLAEVLPGRAQEIGHTLSSKSKVKVEISESKVQSAEFKVQSSKFKSRGFPQSLPTLRPLTSDI